jgi:hypothetical protein
VRVSLPPASALHEPDNHQQHYSADGGINDLAHQPGAKRDAEPRK